MPKKGGKKKIAKKKALKKKSIKKKATKKKISKKKSVTKKKVLKKKTTKKAVKKKTRTKAKPASRSVVKTKVPEMGTSKAVSTLAPSETVQKEEAVGTVTHYYSHLNVAVVQLNRGILKTGDTIHIKGTTTDFTQTVESMEYEHNQITQAIEGQSFGLRVKEHAREHDTVYLVK